MSSEQTKGQKRSWGGRSLLIVSLAANLFLVGVIVGNAQRGPGKGFERNVAFPPMVLNSPMDLRRAVTDPEVGAKLKATLDELRPQMRVSMRDAAESRRAVIAAIKTEPFDPSALAKAFEDTRMADDGVRQLAQNSMQSFIASLTPEQRSELVAELEKMPLRPMGRGGKFRNRDGDGGFPRGPRGNRFDQPPDAPESSEAAPED